MKRKFHAMFIVGLCLTTFLATSARAVVNELVSSRESHSIEKFDSSGTWIKTFASTGPRIPVGIGVSTLGNVFVATLTNTILRYYPNGDHFGPGGTYWDTFDVSAWFGANPVESLVFDSSGNLYVASYYGTSGYIVKILKFSAAQLSNTNPVPSFPIITTTAGRGDQMAFDASGNICIASFLAPNTVECYDPSTGILKFSYAPEFAGFSPTIQPVGLAFVPPNNLYVSSVFAGQVLGEATPHVGPMFVLAPGLTSDINYMAMDSSGMLYATSFHNAGPRYGASCSFYACNDYDFTSDVVYQINPSNGAVINFITTHLWGAHQMIFVTF